MATDPESTPSGWQHALGWFFRRTLLMLVLAVLLTGLYLRMVGLPSWVTEKILAKASEGPYLVELGSMRWSLSHGVILRKVALFRKGVVGDPAIQAGEIILKVDLTELIQGHVDIPTITIRDSVVSPLMVSASHSSTNSPGLGNLAFATRLIMERSEFLGVRVTRFGADLDCKDQTLRLTNFSGDVTGPNTTLPGRLLTGSATYDARTFLLSGDLNAELDPNILAPLYQTLNMNGMHHFVQRFSIKKTSPTFTLQFQKLCRKDGPLTLTGRVGLQDAAYRDIPISRADASIDMLFSGTNSHLIVDPIYLLRPEGHAQGRIAVDYKHPSIDFNGISHFDPRQLVHMIGLFSDSSLEGVTFSGQVDMFVTGHIDMACSDLSDVILHAEADEVHYRKMVVDKGSFDLHHYGRTNDFSNIKCSAYGGTLVANGIVTLPTNSTGHATYSVTGSYDSVDMLALARIKKPSEKDLTGNLSGELYLEGMLGKGQSGTTLGYGKARIRDGRVFSLPIFGGLTKLMGKIIPGLDFVLRQNEANADFTIGNSHVHLRSFSIKGDVLSLECDKGDIGFDKSIDVYVKMKLMKGHTLVSKALRMITWPISSLLEFHAIGTIKDPKWYPTNFSTDLLERIGLKDKSP